MAGRLRRKWAGLHTNEVFFRDTAHGFLAWALASVLVAALASSAMSSAISTSARAISNVSGGAISVAAQAAGANQPDLSGYFLDALFRKDQPDANGPPQDTRMEASRIIAKATYNGSLEPSDRAYLAKLVAVRTGISQQDAEKRVDDIATQIKASEDKAKQVADAARKASASASFFLFFSMLIGAFIASAAGALGGRLRDD